MDSEAAVIRSEMSQTKAELDYKISQLQRKTHAMTPRAASAVVTPAVLKPTAADHIFPVNGRTRCAGCCNFGTN